MTLLTTTERRWGRLIRTTEDLERIDALLNDDTVYLAGRVRTNTMHLIAGAAKAVASVTRSICGKSVSNTYRKPSDGEKVCKFCQKGQQATGFTARNQPRQCQDCGRMFADNADRENNDVLCGACYDKAGRENAHEDGHHRDERDDECPSCQEEAKEDMAVQDAAEAEMQAREDARVEAVAAQQQLAREASVEREERAQHDAAHETGSATLVERDDCDACQENRRAAMLVNEHEEGMHDGKLIADCQPCQQSLAGATVHEPLARLEPTLLQRHAAGQYVNTPSAYCLACQEAGRVAAETFVQTRKRIAVQQAEERIKERIATMAKQLRYMADKVEQQAETILMERGKGDTFQPSDIATWLLQDLMSLPTNAGANEIVRDAVRLERARREGR